MHSDKPTSNVITANSPTTTMGSSEMESYENSSTLTASPKKHQKTQNPAAGDNTTAKRYPEQQLIEFRLNRRHRGELNVKHETTLTSQTQKSAMTGVATPKGLPRRIGGQTTITHGSLTSQHLPSKSPRGDFPAEDVDLLMYSAKELCALIESECYECSAPFLAQLHALSHRMALLANNIALAAQTSEGRVGIGYSPPKLITPSRRESLFTERQSGSLVSPESKNVNAICPSPKTIKRLKIEVPEHPKYNFIGRILGPRGISVRQLETATGCGVLIRGKGSVKDAEREERLRSRNTPGFEHLNEPLHVLLTAEGNDEAHCERKLEDCKRFIDRLLNPEYDEFKRQQLAQLAMINGTYMPP